MAADRMKKKGEKEAVTPSELKDKGGKEERAVEKKAKFDKKAVDKWKKKKLYTILASKEFNHKEIGNTIAEKEKNLIGRTIEANLADLSGQKMKRHVVVFSRLKASRA